MKLYKDLLVSNLIEAIGNKEIKVKEVADFFNSSERTIQKKIKGLGYVWNSKAMNYELIEGANVEGVTIGEVFENKSSFKSPVIAVKQKANTTAAPKTAAKTTSDIAADTQQQSLDRIDILLQGKKENRKYTGFYADSDVLGVLDNVEGRVKSELINECLRVVFKDKGLL